MNKVTSMRKIIFSAMLGVALLTGACSNAQNQSDENVQTAGVINKDIDVKEFADGAYQDNVLLLDVRTDGEFAGGHLEGATQIDYSKSNFEAKIKELDRDQPVYVYCRSGNRSGRAARIMKGLGFKEVYNLEGGILAWQRKGKPVVR
jgi:rhodanese-related sulfurtransferase